MIALLPRLPRRQGCAFAHLLALDDTGAIKAIIEKKGGRKVDDEFFCVFTERHRVPSLFDCIKPPCHEAVSGESLCNICSHAEPDEEGGAEANRLNKLLPEQAL